MITSPKFGAVPDFSGVTAGNALANVLPVDVGLPVTVPEPDAGLLDLAALLALVTTGYTGSHASA